LLEVPLVPVLRSYGDGSDGQTIHLAVGDTIELRLAENPTTGFRWQLIDNEGSVCTVASDSFEIPPGAPGGGGQHSWIIQADQPGECVIELQHRRRFGPPAGTERTFRVHMRVQSG
jgi:inhibitor of cysteine peptidase